MPEKTGLPLAIGEFLTILGGVFVVMGAISKYLLGKVSGVHMRIDNVEKTVKTDYLTKEKHGDLCRIQTLEIKQHVTKEIKSLYNALKTGDSAELERSDDV